MTYVGSGLSLGWAVMIVGLASALGTKAKALADVGFCACSASLCGA